MSLVVFSLFVVPVTGIGLALLVAVLYRVPRRGAASMAHSRRSVSRHQLWSRSHSSKSPA